jgi:hypothetical protein
VEPVELSELLRVGEPLLFSGSELLLSEPGSKVTGLQASKLRNWDSILLHSVQTGPGTHPAYQIVTAGYFRRSKAAEA